MTCFHMHTSSRSQVRCARHQRAGERKPSARLAHPHRVSAPGVGVLRSLALEGKDRLIGLGYDALDPGIYAKELLKEAKKLIASYNETLTPDTFIVLLDWAAHAHFRDGRRGTRPTARSLHLTRTQPSAGRRPEPSK